MDRCATLKLISGVARLVKHATDQMRTAQKTSCRREAATICPRPGLQRKHAAAALSQAG